MRALLGRDQQEGGGATALVFKEKRTLNGLDNDLRKSRILL